MLHALHNHSQHELAPKLLLIWGTHNHKDGCQASVATAAAASLVPEPSKHAMSRASKLNAAFASDSTAGNAANCSSVVRERNSDAVGVCWHSNDKLVIQGVAGCCGLDLSWSFGMQVLGGEQN